MTVGITPDPGLVGPTGPTGATGAAGATGPTGSASSISVAVFTHELALNTDGGTATQGSFIKLTLNTTQFNGITGASLSSSQVTLPAGTYYCQGIQCFYAGVGRIRLKLRNTTDSTDTILGLNYDQNNVEEANAHLMGSFTIAAQKTFEFQYQVQTTVSGNGLGDNSNMGIAEVYTSISFMKVA